MQLLLQYYTAYMFYILKSMVICRELLSLTCAGFQVIVEWVSFVTATIKAIEHTHTLMLAAIIPKWAVIDHWNRQRMEREDV